MSTNGWKNYKLAEVINFNPSERIPKNKRAKKVAMEKLRPYTKFIHGYEIAEFKGGSKFRNGDTLLARITPCLENGKTSQVTLLDNNEVGYGSTEFIVLREKESVTDKEYIYYLSISPEFRDIAINSMVGSSGRQRVQQDVLENLRILLPPLNIQKIIAATLSCLDNKIELNGKINDNLELQAQAIFKSWFIDYKPFDGIIPANWEESTLAECCSLIIKGITPKYADESTQRVINQKCIRDHRIDITLTRPHLPKVINDKWLEFGDILINSTGTGTLGRVAQVLFTPVDLTVDSHVTIVRPRSDELIYFLGLWSLSQENTFVKMATGSTGQTDLPRERLKAMTLIVPNTDILKKFSRIVEPLFLLIISNQQENARLTEIRDALLPKLMSGEIDMSQI